MLPTQVLGLLLDNLYSVKPQADQGNTLPSPMKRIPESMGKR